MAGNVDQLANSTDPASKRGAQSGNLYSPTTIFIYTVVGVIGTGIVLYGLNLFRRGQKAVGVTFLTIGALAFLGVCAVVVLVVRGSSSSVLLVLVLAAALFKSEEGPYQRAIKIGYGRAKWWPPLVIAVVAIIVVLVIAALSSPLNVLANSPLSSPVGDANLWSDHISFSYLTGGYVPPSCP
jgi:hypothetical protein